MTKKCNYCNEEKEINQFPLDPKGNVKGHKCKDCVNKALKLKRAKKKLEKLSEDEPKKDNVRFLDQDKPLEVEMDFNSTKSDPKIHVKDIDISSLIDTCLMSGSNIVSKRLGNHWKIDKDESQSVSKPLSNILSKLEIAKKLEQNSDLISVIVASGAILIPRIMIQKEIINNMRGKTNGSNKGNETKNNTKTGSNNSSTNTNDRTKPGHENQNDSQNDEFDWGKFEGSIA